MHGTLATTHTLYLCILYGCMYMFINTHTHTITRIYINIIY